MREIRTSGSMSGEGKRGVAKRPKPPRLSSTLPKRTFQTVSFMSAFGGKAAGNWSPCFRLLLTQLRHLTCQDYAR